MAARESEDSALRHITVCFTGHRQIEQENLPVFSWRLDQVLEALWQRGFRRFICGGALGFDTLAAECVLHLQVKHADVRLIMAIPCASQSRRWSPADAHRYERILYAADETRVLSPAYYQGCMLVRNRYMVDRASFCVCYLNKMKGGTVSTVAYAAKAGISLLNVAMEDACTAFLQENMLNASP